MRFAKLAVAGVLGLSCVAAHAQNFPSKPIRIVIGFPPGGGIDLVARILAAKMTESMGQQVIVENKPGANGVIATQQVAKSPADGYTVFIGTTGNLSVNPVLYNDLPFNIARDFVPLTQTSSVPFLLYAHPALPAKTVGELVALAKASPGKVNFYSSGVGGLPHLTGELLNMAAAIKTIHVPYKGSAPGLNDVIGGHIHFGFDAVAIGLPHVKASRLRALATTAPARLAFLADVPAMNETLSGFEVVNWYGMVLPTGTPREAIGKLHGEIVKTMAIAEIKEKLIAQGTDPVGTTPEQFGAFMKSESAKWSRVIKEANIRPE